MRDISERRRRERERNERVQQQRAIAQFGQYALGQRDIDEVLIRATELVADLLNHDYCEILNYEPREDTLHHRISVGWNGDLAGEGAVEMSRETQAGHALRSNEPVVVTDFETEDRFGGRDLSESRDAASGICVSVGAVDVPWGVLGTYDGEPNDYSEHDVQFVQTIANILGNAIARHERETQLRALTEELRRLPDAETTIDLYAGETGAFDQLEVAVLRELGETIGYAVDALARKKALVGDSSVELKFRIANLEAPFLGFVDGTHGSFELESIVQRSDGHIHVFFTLTGVSPDSVLADAGASTAVVDSTLVTETDDGGVYECTLATATFLPNVLERGVNLHTLLVDDGTASIGLRIPKTADVRNFIETFQDEFGTVELVTRREVDQPVMSADEFKNTVRERLTARQEEVVQTAYFSGFFEWPRESTGGEVADILGVTQPTVNRHIRAGERTLFGLVYEDYDADVQESVDTG